MCAQLTGDEGRVVRTLPPGMIQGTVPQGLRMNEWIVSYTALERVLILFLLLLPSVFFV